MNKSRDVAYYARREAQERARAAAAGDQSVAQIHLDLAEHYGDLIRSAEPAPGARPPKQTLRLVS